MKERAVLLLLSSHLSALSCDLLWVITGNDKVGTGRQSLLITVPLGWPLSSHSRHAPKAAYAKVDHHSRPIAASCLMDQMRTQGVINDREIIRMMLMYTLGAKIVTL